MVANRVTGVKKTLKEYRRVLKITRKPDREEFFQSAQVTGAGILLVGGIGFLIYVIALMARLTIGGGA